MMSFNDAAIRAMQEWEQAWQWHQQEKHWCAANPEAKFYEMDAWLKAQGIPRITEAGRLNGQLGRTREFWWTLRLRQPTEHGRYLLECRQCLKVAFTDHVMLGAGLCGTCRAQQLEARKVVQAERRIERRRKRSSELANRKGKCLVCSAEITVARITKTTCSDRCRKQWIRKGAEAFPLPETPQAVLIGEQELPLARALQRLQQASFNRSRALSDKTTEYSFSAFEAACKADDQYQQLKAAIAQVSRLLELQRLRETAPAIFLWELSQ